MLVSQNLKFFIKTIIRSLVLFVLKTNEPSFKELFIVGAFDARVSSVVLSGRVVLLKGVYSF
jgi:hypothetical protein